MLFAESGALPAWWLHHVPLAVMLACARLRQRSLGAWVPYLAAVAAAFGLTAFLMHAGTLPTLLPDLLFAPTALLFLARQQSIPGLRRGQMTPGQRAQWIAAHALANTQPHVPIGLAAPSVRRVLR